MCAINRTNKWKVVGIEEVWTTDSKESFQTFTVATKDEPEIGLQENQMKHCLIDSDFSLYWSKTQRQELERMKIYMGILNSICNECNQPIFQNIGNNLNVYLYL